MKDEKKYIWKKIYSHIIPSVLTLLYLIYLMYGALKPCKIVVIQSSEHFDKMLETLVTFMSIILSVFGFLIPSFLGSKGDSETLKYFMKYADMKVFAAKLKNVVAVGLIDIFITSTLLLSDIIPNGYLDFIILIWLWMIFFFMCSSYRFISLMIALLLVEKENFVQKAANSISEKEKNKLHSDIRRLE